MQPGERVAAIQAVARSLAEMDGADRELILRQFGLPRSQPDDYFDSYHYSVHQVEQADDAKLLAVRDFLRSEGREAPLFEPDDEGPWRPGAFRLFVSHTSGNRERAGKLAEALRPAGVDAFVAHDAIEPAREWQEEIEKALRSCDALCALLTPDFVESRWCDQEVGLVVGRRKLVVPLKMGADPHGFIGKYQAIPVGGEAPPARVVADSVLRALIRSPLTAEAVAPTIVRRYAKSPNYDAARAGFELLESIPRGAWTRDMVREVLDAPLHNTQIENGNLIRERGGRAIPDAARALIQDLGIAADASPAPDDDLPF